METRDVLGEVDKGSRSSLQRAARARAERVRSSVESLRSTCEETFTGMLNSLNSIGSNCEVTFAGIAAEIAMLQEKINENRSFLSDACITMTHSSPLSINPSVNPVCASAPSRSSKKFFLSRTKIQGSPTPLP